MSGDLFTDDYCDSADIFRVENPASANPTAVVYAQTPSAPNGQISFSPDGTLYLTNGNGGAVRISGTGAPQPPTVTMLGSPTGIGGSESLLVGSVTGSGDAASLFFDDGDPDQEIAQFDLAGSPPQLSSVLLKHAGGGYLVKGPDECLYLAMGDTVYKISNDDGPCPLAAAKNRPQLHLTPAAVTPSPAQGTSVTVTAAVHYAEHATNKPVNFLISGANAQVRMVRTDADGNAALSYRALKAGTDKIVAMATLDGTPVTSNQATVTWTAGVHSTALSLNSSARSSIAEHNVTLRAQLLDTSLSPQASLADQPVVLAVGGVSCSATTDAQGKASCQVNVTAIGQNRLTATYVGEAGSYTPASATQSFTVYAGAPAPPKPHNGGVSTTSGTPVHGTLSASGSGPLSFAINKQPHHGTVTLTNAATGAFTYTPGADFSGTDSFPFTASNSGGSSGAATESITVTQACKGCNASGGGGSTGWPTLLELLGLLGVGVAIRRRAGR